MIKTIDLLLQAQAFIQQRYESNGGLLGISSGYKCVDNASYGFQKGNLISIKDSGSGSFAFMFSLLYRLILKKVPAALFSFKTPELVTGIELVKRSSKISRMKIMSGHLKNEEIKTIQDETKKIADSPFFMDLCKEDSEAEVFTKIRNSVKENNVQVVFIDSAHKLSSAYSQKLKQLASELEITIILFLDSEQQSDYSDVNILLEKSDSVNENTGYITYSISIENKNTLVTCGADIYLDSKTGVFLEVIE